MTLPIVSSARLGKHRIYISPSTRFLRHRSPGHVRPVHRCTRRCPAPCQARLVRGMGQREVSAPSGFGASRGPRPLAGGAKRGIGRARLWLQPYDLGPDSASPPATGPLTGAPRRRCLGDDHHRGRQKTMAEPEVREASLPAAPGSRNSGYPRRAGAPPHRGLREAPWAPGEVAPATGVGAGPLRPQARHCRSQTVQGLGNQTHPTSALSPLGGLGKDTQPLSLFSHLKNAGL